ncbi:hypothetical protein LTR97_006932 [Elasticomyces elasticus]|uniref:Uncharacterized protein n=1 Tax=Elasticomyces elasticus TaxID=574655 RepID=A0AAN7VQ46_9PEZI|nr:hypothetical protein LTR97_006932 [Elasticomyces elasticus]
MASQNTTALPSEPATPQPSHASLHSTTATTAAAVTKPQSKPPTRSTKPSKTPTPPISPPPTIEAAAPPPRPLPTTMTPTEIATASPETLRAKVTDLQRQLQETKTTTSAHHTLQLHMLAQESSAALERLAVEARMERHESEVIHLSSQRSAKAVQPPSLPEGCIAVNRDLYLRMGNEIRELRDANQAWRDANTGLERVVGRQESEIASLGDKVTLMRERIRENREHLNRVRSGNVSTSSRSSLYGTPQRSQGLEALLQASEMTGLQPQSQHKRKGGHTRNTHSLSSLPATPQRKPIGPPPMAFMTPSNRRTVAKVPATAPMPRTSAMRTPTNVYSQPVLPVPQRERAGSDGTVSASDSDDEVVGEGGMGGELGGEGEDSEAETDILGHGDATDDAVDIGESLASRAASQMLRASQQDGSGMKTSFGSSGEALRQTKLFGAITKGGVLRGEDGMAGKRKRSEEDVGSGVARVGLGISGVRD